jgi:hypothetical protein
MRLEEPEDDEDDEDEEEAAIEEAVYLCGRISNGSASKSSSSRSA